MFSHVVYIVNPASQNGATGRQWPELARRLPPAVEVLRTTAPGEAMSLARAAADGGADLVVSVGGDGTLNEVTSGLMLVPEKQRPALAIVPRGTGGDFRRTLGYPRELEAIAAILRRGRTKHVDVGRLQYRGPAGTDVVRHFINICSFGISGVVDEAVNRSTKMFGGKASFLIGAVRGLMKFKPVSVELSVDDGPFERYSLMIGVVANGRAFGGGMWVAPTADPSDGSFDVLWLSGTAQDFALKVLPAVYSGAHLGLPGVRYHSATRLRARSDDTVLLDVDGEQLGRLPIEVECVPRALRIIV